MAIMIPPAPKEADSRSREAEIFEAFESGLPDDYYVFHSLSYYMHQEKGLVEGEVDFLIFHPSLGLLFLEAKAGAVSYQYGMWCYADGCPMKHGGPFQQAANSKWKLLDYFRKRGYAVLAKKCKFIHAVCFPSIHRQRLQGVSLPPESDKNLIITADDLLKPQAALERIFAHDLSSQIQTSLSPGEAQLIIEKILAPCFHLMPLASTQPSKEQQLFVRMIEEQARILDFLTEEPNAVINGAAGTGKTLIALQKAVQHAEQGERVLFLCFNKYLQDYLREQYKSYQGKIDFYTIDAYCKASRCLDLQILEDALMTLYYNADFPYKHVIIDEGQDFGQERIEQSRVIYTLRDCVLSEEVAGSFYVFYDKKQLVQGSELPKFIQTADCRLCLRRNCRNTSNIAKTSLRPLPSQQSPQMMERAPQGDLCQMSITDDMEAAPLLLQRHLDELIDKKIVDIAILTCGTEEKSFVWPHAQEGIYSYRGKKIKFTTCRKFKGLEADAVILVDVDKRALTQEEQARVFYVGASRAKLYLSIIACLKEEDCRQILRTNKNHPLKRMQRQIASSLNSRLYL